jgi:hypothetical protein
MSSLLIVVDDNASQDHDERYIGDPPRSYMNATMVEEGTNPRQHAPPHQQRTHSVLS